MSAANRWRPPISCLLIVVLAGVLLSPSAAASPIYYGGPPSNMSTKAGLITLGALTATLVVILLVKHSHHPSGDAFVSAAPGRLDFGRVPVGGSATRSLTIRNKGRSDLELHSSLTAGGFFALAEPSQRRFTLAGGSQATLSVVFSPNSAGKCRGELVTTTGDQREAGSKRLIVPLNGQGLTLARSSR